MSSRKLESNFFNMVFVLFLVCFVSSFLLGWVYNQTKDRIDEAKQAKMLRAIDEVVVAGYENKPNEDLFPLPTEEGKDLECYPTKVSGELTSVAVRTYTKLGFNGHIGLMVGFLPDGTIHKISVVEQSETPGLGTKMKGDQFKGQFEGKNPETFRLKVKKDGGDVDAITAATITSRAFCDAVERAYKAFKVEQKN